jgi:hypothetical protein
MVDSQNNTYSDYTLLELQDLLNRIDKEKYPERVELIKEQIVIKESLEMENSYKLFNKDRVVYKSKFFVLSLMILLCYSFLDNLLLLLFTVNVISVFYLISTTIVLYFLLSNNQKQKIIIKIYSYLIMIPGSLKLLALFLLLIKYIGSPSEENWSDLGLHGSFYNFTFYTIIIYFGFGLYYALTINKNVKNKIINNK